MKQIIVPTDFSKGAWNALLYAVEIGEALEVREIVVLNSYHAPHAGAATLVSIDRIMQKDSEDGLLQLMDKIKESGLSARFNFHSKSIHAGLVEAVNSLITAYNDTLVVMGSLGATGTIGKIFGSNASDVALSVNCPVMVIPPETSYQGHRNIVMGSDFNQLSQNNLNILRTINRLNDHSKLKIVHVQTDDEPATSKASLGITQEDIAHEILEIKGEEVSGAIDDYVSKNDVDLLVMIKKEGGFFYTMFHRSITKKMALLGHVPLLVLK